MSRLKSRSIELKMSMLFSPLFLVNQGTIAVGSTVELSSFQDQEKEGVGAAAAGKLYDVTL